MVKILANGEIVHDNDARLNQRRPQSAFGNPNLGRINSSNDGDDNRGDAADGGGQQVNIFTTFNTKLLEMGVPRVPIGSWVLEPIALVGMLIALLLLGIPGLMFAGLLFIVYSMSMQSSGGNRAAAGGGGFRLPRFGGGRGLRTGRR